MIQLQEQQQFSRMVLQLLAKAFELGYEVTFGEAWNAAGVGHMPDSLHYIRLAIDLNLFRAGVWLQSTEDHRALGEWWESIGGTWGGRFKDGNHYSLAYGGRK